MLLDDEFPSTTFPVCTSQCSNKISTLEADQNLQTTDSNHPYRPLYMTFNSEHPQIHLVRAYVCFFFKTRVCLLFCSLTHVLACVQHYVVRCSSPPQHTVYIIFKQDLVFSCFGCNTVEPLYYKPLKCGNLYNKDTILCPSVVLKCIK